tara:strand:- start:4034 stop:4444 length:411 start_codon:yes stop_codon:yes gene_type:complete
MEKEFVSYEIALALKELGFDEPCFGVYSEKVFKWTRHLKGWEDSELENVTNTRYADEKSVVAPLYQQAFNWFRLEYKLDFFVVKDSLSLEYFFDICWCNKKGILKDFQSEEFKTHEEAEIEGLKKLIKKVKNKKTK